MKKIITLSAVAAFSAVAANAQVELGFNFNGLGATSDVDGFTADAVSPSGSASSQGVGVSISSTLLNAQDPFDFTTVGGPGTFPAVQGAFHQIRGGAAGIDPAITGNTNGSNIGLNGITGLAFAGDIASQSVSFDFDFTPNTTTEIDGLSFAYDLDGTGNDLASGGFIGASNTWEYSLNGGTFQSVGTDNVGANAGLETFTLGDFSGVTSFTLRYTFDGGITDANGDGAPFGGDLDLISFDNLVFFGDNDGTATFTSTVVPEPSTYAAIFGALALAFVAYRRRK